ncbi:hypothetical protein RRG08_024794, partial [Elysia crispata]
MPCGDRAAEKNGPGCLGLNYALPLHTFQARHSVTRFYVCVCPISTWHCHALLQKSNKPKSTSHIRKVKEAGKLTGPRHENRTGPDQ